MTVIDCHCHIYPEKIATQASESVGSFYLVPMYSYNPTSADLLGSCKDSPITHHVVHSVATKPSSVEAINNFIAEQCRLHPEFIGFATMHQDYKDPEKEIERAIEMGLKGLKLHPDTQKVNMDDPQLMSIYEIIAGRIPLIVHCGDYRYPYSHPSRLKKILRTFPDLVVDAAHMGGWSIFNQVVDILGEENCFFDMSSSLPFLGSRRTYELAKHYGTNRIMFGSDFPMWNPIEEYNAFVSAPFTDDELENMLWHNCERFLGFEVN